MMESKHKITIIAIVVLYNPNEEIIHNINSYYNDVDCIFVLDNTEDNVSSQEMYDSG